MERIFVGSEAIAAGELNANDLRRRHRPLFPDVYGPRQVDLTLSERIRGAWLWSKREGVVAGVAASALHGASWVDVATPIELIWTNNRAAKGVVTRRDTLLDDETTVIGGLPVTTADRTAFDLARRGSIGAAVARLDALARVTHFKADDVQALALSHPHVRGRAASTA